VVPLISGAVSAIKVLFNSLLPIAVAIQKFYIVAWGRIFETIIKFVSALTPTFQKLGQIIAKLFNGDSGEKFEAVFAAIASYIDKLIPTVNQFFDIVDAGAAKIAGLINGLFTGEGGNPFAGIADDLEPVITLLTTIGTAATKVFAAVRQVWGATLAAINAQLDKLQPQFEKIGNVVQTVFSFASEQGNKLSEALGSIASRVGPPLMAFFERLGVVIGKVWELANALVSLIGNTLVVGFQRLAAVVGPVFDWIGTKAQALFDKMVDGFNYLWEPVKAVVSKISSAFLTVAYTIEHYLTWAINRAIDTLNGFIKKLQAALDIANKLNPGEDIKIGEIANVGKTSDEDKKKSYEALRTHLNTELGQAAQPAAKPQPVAPVVNDVFNAVNDGLKKVGDTQKQQKGNDFNGQLLGNARIIGISEAMRAAQQSTVPTRESVLLSEISRKVGDQGNTLEQIKDNTGKQPNLGLGK
jgi:phage-related protein